MYHASMPLIKRRLKNTNVFCYVTEGTGKTTATPSRVKQLLTSKTSINNKTPQQINTFNSLGYGITCATEDDPAKGSTDTRFSKAQV
jgi:hypothetical protein